MGKRKEPEDPLQVYAQYRHLNKPLAKIRALAEIAQAASTTEIQVPVQQVKTNDQGEQEVSVVMSERRRIGQYEEIFRVLLMKTLEGRDIDKSISGGDCD